MLIWMDGFDSYGTSGSPAPAGIITRKYTTATEGNITIATGRIGGKAITLSGGIFSSLGPGNITADGTMVVGAAIKFAGLYNGRFFLFFDGVTEGMNLRVQTDGELAVYLSDTLKQTTLGLGLVGSIWYYI